MSKLELIETIVLAAVLVIVLVYYMIAAIKNGWIKKLTKTINEALRYAEDNIKGSEEKKKYVLTKVEEKCIELNIPYFMIQWLISKLINKVISHKNIFDHKNEISQL